MSLNKIKINDTTTVNTGIVYDISKANNRATYTDLADALGTDGINVPLEIREGGMIIRFVSNSDNKYVQYRLLTNEFTADTTQWAIADEGVYVQNPEYVYVKTDKEGKILWAIKIDSDIYYGAGCPQQVIDYIEEKLGDFSLDEYEDIVVFLADLEERDKTLQTLLNEKVDKEEGKSLIEDEVKECFGIIENEEFLKAIVDSEQRVLFGIYRDSGKPYFPLNEMYHVEQNEEFFAVWLDATNHVLFGIRRDGQIIGEIHAVNALKNVLSQLQEKVDTIDTNLKELLDVFSLKENPEYMAVETDAEGKILSSTNADGSHYLYKIKSETIDTKVDKETGKSLINSDVADSQSVIDDVEGRTEIITDADGKVLSERSAEGVKHETSMKIDKLKVLNLNLSGNSINDIKQALIYSGFKTTNPSDFSNYSHVELPIPRVAAHVVIYATKLPISKTDDVEAEIEYNDKDGNYFRKPVILNSQGSSSMNYIDPKTGEKHKAALPRRRMRGTSEGLSQCLVQSEAT